MSNFSLREIKALSWAVQAASEWRGAEVGNPDPEPLQRFDSAMREARMALRKAKEIRKRLKGQAHE